MGARNWFIVTLVIGIMMATSVTAFADYSDKETWFLGLDFGYWTVDPWLDYIYEENASVSGSPFGLQGGYKWELSDIANVEVVGYGQYWSINKLEETTWMIDGGKPGDETDIRETSDISMFALGCQARFPIIAHDIVQPVFTIGLGLGFTTGDAEKRDYGEETLPNNEKIGVPDPEWEDANVPTVIPVLDALFGVRFAIPDNVNIDINAGFKTGLYAGMAIMYVY